MARRTGFIRKTLGALMALVGLGVGQAPQPNVPAPQKEYIAAPSERKARKKKVRKLLPFMPMDPNFPIIRAWLVPGATNTYGLGALTAKRMAGLSRKEREMVERGYCERLYLLKTSKGSQSTFNHGVAQ